MKESINPDTVKTPPTIAQTLVKKCVNDLYSSRYCTCASISQVPEKPDGTRWAHMFLSPKINLGSLI